MSKPCRSPPSGSAFGPADDAQRRRVAFGVVVEDRDLRAVPAAAADGEQVVDVIDRDARRRHHQDPLRRDVARIGPVEHEHPVCPPARTVRCGPDRLPPFPARKSACCGPWMMRIGAHVAVLRARERQHRLPDLRADEDLVMDLVVVHAVHGAIQLAVLSGDPARRRRGLVGGAREHPDLRDLPRSSARSPPRGPDRRQSSTGC